MIRFDPPGLASEIVEAFKVLDDAFGGSECLQTMEEDRGDHEGEDLIINRDWVMEGLHLDGTEEQPELTVSQFLELARAFASSSLTERSVVHGVDESIYHLVPANDEAFALEFIDSEKQIETSYRIGGCKFQIRLTRGHVLFATHLAARGGYDAHYAPTFSSGHFFAVLNCPAMMPQASRDNILEAFLFELAASTQIQLSRGRVLEVADEDEFDEFVQKYKMPNGEVRIREVQVTRGMADLYVMYNAASNSIDEKIAFLGFARVLEYISATIVRLEIHKDIRSKLLLPDALNPSAEFLDMLMQTMDKSRSLQSDSEALRFTIERISDAVVLAKLAPPHLQLLCSIVPASKAEDKRRALNSLSEAISNTRNQLSHAKPNYVQKGCECPESEFGQFLACVKFAALDAIRNFSDIPERLRVV